MVPLGMEPTFLSSFLASFFFSFFRVIQSKQLWSVLLAIKQHEKENHKIEKAYAFSLSMEPETRSTTWTTRKPEMLWILSTAFDSSPTPMPQSIVALCSSVIFNYNPGFFFGFLTFGSISILYLYIILNFIAFICWVIVSNYHEFIYFSFRINIFRKENLFKKMYEAIRVISFLLLRILCTLSSETPIMKDIQNLVSKSL